MDPVVPAVLFVVVVALAAVFQLALAAGAPWGRLAMGGKFPGRLPPGMRVAAAVQALVLLGLGTIVLARAQVMLPSWLEVARTAIWVVVVFSAMSLLLNLVTPSPWERRVWAPVALVLLVTSTLVARS